MARKRNSSDLDFLSFCKQAIEAGESHSEIMALFAAIQLGEEDLGYGRTLLNRANVAYDNRIDESLEEGSSYEVFDKELSMCLETYYDHKEAADIAFLKDSSAKAELQIDTALPNAYVNRKRAVETFYKKLSENSDYLAKMARFQVDLDTVNECLDSIKRVEAARKAYTDDRGEAQEATLEKDEALAKLDDWMDEYIALAKYALKRKPQLLEVLGVVVPR